MTKYQYHTQSVFIPNLQIRSNRWTILSKYIAKFRNYSHHFFFLFSNNFQRRGEEIPNSIFQYSIIVSKLGARQMPSIIHPKIWTKLVEKKSIYPLIISNRCSKLIKGANRLLKGKFYPLPIRQYIYLIFYPVLRVADHFSDIQIEEEFSSVYNFVLISWTHLSCIDYWLFAIFTCLRGKKLSKKSLNLKKELRSQKKKKSFFLFLIFEKWSIIVLNVGTSISSQFLFIKFL